MANRLGSANICITQLRDGFSSAVVTLYRESASSEKPLRLLYTFSSGELASGVDGKTLSECLNGWSTERSATTHYAISASVRSDGEIGEILPSSWSDSYLVAEKGETIVSVTLYQRAIESPERPTTAITYNFYTGAVTGGLGAWSASIPEWGTAPLWSISAVASAVLSEGKESDEISASEWSAPKKVAENGESPVEIYFSTYSWLFPADSDGLVSAEEYAKFQVDVNAVKGNSAVEVALSCELTGITNITVSGNSIVGSEKSVMLGDSASVKVSVVVEGVTYSRMITLAKAKQSKSATLYFAWSKSESIFTPKDSNFWIMGTSFIFFNNSLMGNIPFTSSWVDNWEEIQSAKTDEYCYLWCKTSEDGTPFLFTGATGKTGAYTIYRYALSTSGTTAPTDGWQDTLPTITTDSPYLWIKAGKVVAGGSDSDATWSDATLLGTDSSQVYAKIEEEAEARKLAITNLSATGGAIESKIESYKIDSEGHTLSQAGTLIQQTEDRIALKVVSGGEGTVEDSSGKTVSGITIKEGIIQLTGDVVIEKGSLTGDTFTSTNLIQGKTFKVNNGGAIQSDEFATYNSTDGGKGFNIESNGHAEFNDILVGGNAIIKGTVDNDVLRTVQKATDGETITNPEWPGGTYWSGAESANILTSYSSSKNCVLTINGKSYTGTLSVKDDYISVGYTYERATYNSQGLITGVYNEWRSYAGFYTEKYYIDVVTVTLSDGTVVFDSANYLNYVQWSGTGKTTTIIGTSTASGNTFAGVDANGKTVEVTPTSITVADVGTVLKGEWYNQSTWPTYSLTLVSEDLGTYVTDLFPENENDSNIGGPADTQKFNKVYAKQVLADNFYPVGALYLTLGSEKPAELFGGSWCLLPANYALWTAQSGVTCPTTNSGDSDNLLEGSLPGIAGIFPAQGSDAHKLDVAGAFKVLDQGHVDSGTSGGADFANRIWFNAHLMTDVYRNCTKLYVSGNEFIQQDDYSTVRPTSYKIYAWRRYA